MSQPMRATDVAGAVGSTLHALGVDRVFGLVGSGNFIVTTSLIQGGATFLSARHETSAVTMADGFARVSGAVGVVTVHQGPGFTNALTGLAESAKAGTPLVLVAADTPSEWTDSNFLVDQAAMARAVGAEVLEVESAPDAVETTKRAFHLARDEHRAVVLLLPLDVQGEPVDQPIPGTEAASTADHWPDPADIAAMTEAVAASNRPLIVAGRGAVVSESSDVLRRLGSRMGSLLATSANAHGLFANDPFSLGISGGFASPVAAEMIPECDLVLSFGASLNRWTTRHGRLLRHGPRIVQVDRVYDRIGLHVSPEIGVVGDVHATADALLTSLESAGVDRPRWRSEDVARRIASGGWHSHTFEDQSTDDRIDPRSFTLALDELLPLERTVTIDSGHFSGWAAMYLRVPDARGFVFNQAYQSVGVGFGAAIGAAVANPNRVSVAAVGDGGAFMTLGELDTAVRSEMPIAVIIYNDDAYGAEVHHFGPDGHPLDTVRFPETDLAAIGRAAGARGVTVRQLADLETVRKWAAEPSGTIVIDAKVSADVVGAWLPEAFRQ